jgi:hypothetical protein
MKNRLFIAALILTLVSIFASCTSQKYGCPGVQQASARFRA